MPTHIPVAIIQHAPVFLNLQQSLERALDLIAQATSEGARVIAFPETWLPGYPLWLDYAPEAGVWDHPGAKALFRALYENSPTIPGPEFQTLREAAQKHNTSIIMGMNERMGNTLYNTILSIAPTGDWKIRRKLMPTYTERMVWGRGDGSTLEVLNTESAVIGAMICWEHWMPLLRAAMHAQKEQIHIAQWPMVKDLHHIASRQYAFEGQCFVLATGCAITQSEVLQGYQSLHNPSTDAVALLKSMPVAAEDWVHTGGSAIIAPDTSYLVEPVRDTQTIIHADLNLDLIAEGALTMDSDGHYARPDIFQLHVNTSEQTNVTFQPKS